MSRSQNPVTGAMSGSYGNITTLRFAGKNFIRAKPFEPKDAKTPKQLLHREKFSMLADIYTAFGGITDTGFLLLKKGMTGYNTFISTNLKRVFDKTSKVPVIDYSRLLVSKGAIPRVSVLESGVGAEGITIRYETTIGLPKVSATDELTAFACLKSKELLIEIQTRGNEETGTMVLECPDLNVEDVVCCYLFARSADGKMSSNSVLVTLT